MNNQIDWKQPIPLKGNRTNLVKFPTSALPEILRETSEAIAVTTSTDASMACTALLSALSYCFSGVYRMTGKRDHTEPLVINSLIVAEPSSKKSPVIAIIKNPFLKFAEEWNENHKSEVFQYQAKRDLLESQLYELKKKKDITADEITDIQMQISNLQEKSFRRIIVDDITPESLVGQLKINGTLLMMSDEAGMLGNFNGRYSNNVPNLDLLLKSWNGETYISDRATRESIVLKRPYLSICLACQPYIFENMINNSAFRGSGLIARLIYCFPESNIGKRKYDTDPIPQKILDDYNKLIYKLLNDKFSYSGKKEMYLHFDKNAYMEFVNFYNNCIEPKLITDMAFCKDWGGKYHGLILRLCGVIHCIKCACCLQNPVEIPVNTNTLCNSIEISEYYREQAIYAYSLGDTDIATVKAERVLDKIYAKHILNIRQNDLYRICRCSLFVNAKDFSETIELLEEYGYIKCTESKGSNNKTIVNIEVNPYIYK